jgi:hypothetical protein
MSEFFSEFVVAGNVISVPAACCIFIYGKVFLACNQKVPGLNLGQNILLSQQFVFIVFSQFLQANVRKVAVIRPLQLPCISFPIQYLPIIMPFNIM